MSIHEIIREKRLARGLTQEQTAEALGVSAPAVSKWENGASYPDIALLPALARLLGTDLNTLLAFQVEPSREEIAAFLNELTAEPLRSRGLGAVLQRAEETLREYPSCGLLALNTALALKGLMMVEQREDPEASARVEALFRQAADSPDDAVSRQARAMLISAHMGRGELDAAQQLLDQLPDADLFDKKQLQASLYLRRGKLADAAEILERKLLFELNGAQSTLTALMDAALKEGRTEDARKMAETASQLVRLTGMWEYGAYTPLLQIAWAEKDGPAAIAALEGLAEAMRSDWDTRDTLLFRHIPVKERQEDVGRMVLPALLRELEDPRGEYAFLQKERGYAGLVERFRSAAENQEP